MDLMVIDLTRQRIDCWTVRHRSSWFKRKHSKIGTLRAAAGRPRNGAGKASGSNLFAGFIKESGGAVYASAAFGKGLDGQPG